MSTTIVALSLAIALHAAPAAPAKKDAAAAEREKKELRLVEILRGGLKQGSKPDPSLMFDLAGVDPKNPPSDAGQKLAATQADILGRRDPALRDEMLAQTKLYLCRTKQSEARANLMAIATAQAAWQAEHDKYSANLKELELGGLEIRRYDYSLVEGTAKTFRARATGREDMAGDVWEIDQTREPKNTANACGAAKK